MYNFFLYNVFSLEMFSSQKILQSLRTCLFSGRKCYTDGILNLKTFDKIRTKFFKSQKTPKKHGKTSNY